MLRFLVSASIGVCSLFFCTAYVNAAPPEVSAWWAAATEAFGQASSFQPSRTVIRIEELDAAGEVSSYERGETRLDWSGGSPSVVVVKAEKNGKDVTEDWRKRYAKPSRESSGGPPAGFDATPFDPKYSKAVSRGDPRPGVGSPGASLGSGVLEVPYSISTAGGPVEGLAVFSSAGSALRADQAWTKPPLLVSSMRSTIRYAYHEGALVVAGMVIEGEASILFVKRRFRMAFEFSEWRRSPA